MESRDTIARRAAYSAAAVSAAFAIAIVMTWPLASNMGGLGRSTGGGDGQYSVWNVAWVAHALTTDPTRLFDANIFYPHRNALAFSEANLGAGIVAIPAWLMTHNAYAAHNLALLTGFATALLGMWLLARELTGSAAVALVAALAAAWERGVLGSAAQVEARLSAGAVRCPGCGDSLSPWGWTRSKLQNLWKGYWLAFATWRFTTPGHPSRATSRSAVTPHCLFAPSIASTTPARRVTTATTNPAASRFRATGDSDSCGGTSKYA